MAAMAAASLVAGSTHGSRTLAVCSSLSRESAGSASVGNASKFTVHLRLKGKCSVSESSRRDIALALFQDGRSKRISVRSGQLSRRSASVWPEAKCRYSSEVICKSSSDFASSIASTEEFATGGGDGNIGGSKGGEGGGGGGGDGEADGDAAKNKAEALAVLAVLKRSLDSLPSDIAQAISDGKLPAKIVQRFAELENTFFVSWLMKFAGFKERLLADDLFLTKVAIECGVGVFTKTAAEIERRREKFWKEFDFVIADVIMAVIADFMLVWLPAPTVSLRPSLTKSASALTRFFYNCPDNAFQVALRGTSYTLLQRLAAIVRNGSKLLAVGTTASLFGTVATNGLSAIRKVGSKEKPVEVAEETEVPILATSVAYGVYMAVSSNLRYQVLAGVVEQRLLEPMLHDKKLALSVLSFIARTGNTFLGSLMWVDYARWIGVQ